LNKIFIMAIQKSFGRLEAGPTVEPASSRRGKTFLDKYMGAQNLAAEFPRCVLSCLPSSSKNGTTISLFFIHSFSLKPLIPLIHFGIQL